jgi:hypothetical protein
VPFELLLAFEGFRAVLAREFAQGVVKLVNVAGEFGFFAEAALALRAGEGALEGRGEDGGEEVGGGV